MLTVVEKTLLGFIVVLTLAVAAHFIIPTHEVGLISTPRSVVDAPLGESFNVTCEVFGADENKFSPLTWLDPGGQVVPPGIPGVRKGEKNSLILYFTDPKAEDSGTYRCETYYNNKYFLYDTITITFYERRPTFRTGYEGIKAEDGSYFEVSCNAEGDTPIRYSWHTQFEDLISDDSNSSIYVSSDVDNSSSLLVFRSVSLSDEGQYTCTAENDHGSSSKIYELTVLPSQDNNKTDDKPSLRGVTTTNITSTSVTFDLDIVGSVTRISVKYMESRIDMVHELSWSYGDVYEVKGLIPGGLYNFTFNVGLQQEEPWFPYQVTLLPDTPEVIFRHLGAGQIKIEWLRKFEDVMRGTVDRYELSYYTLRMEGVDSKWVPSNCVITIQIPSCTNRSYMISGLSQNVYYEIQLRAHTASGFGEPYKQKIFMSSNA